MIENNDKDSFKELVRNANTLSGACITPEECKGKLLPTIASCVKPSV